MVWSVVVDVSHIECGGVMECWVVKACLHVYRDTRHGPVALNGKDNLLFYCIWSSSHSAFSSVMIFIATLVWEMG